ncbi:leucyl aminopeptidase [Kroppenstedtia pulmonis]|uniref:Probable cytosol aminopeptidase n=1 Tax=Kroppenstedtia pulmonis TaxID=1380685 RepID=A0A7D4BQE6_9BACL|nr:leucyl aminopeptidase [Kroppenstedtia pulmonis]QKG84811.1 leucyl aminopeptidase [Kroppenstedtia pulmonis]
MEWKVTKEPLYTLATDCLVVIQTQGGESLKGCIRAMDEALDHRISQLMADGEITGRYQEVTMTHNWGKIPAKRLLILGMGKEEDLTLEKLRNGISVAACKARDAGVKRLTLGCSKNLSERWNAADLVQALVEGVELGVYRYRGYKQENSKENRREIEEVWLSLEDVSDSAFEAGLERGRVFAAGTKAARNLVNEPANKLTPSALAEYAKKIADHLGMKAEILDEKKLKELNMNALLAVSKASAEEPRMIVLSYQGAPDSQEVLGLVGKGVTFDSGGIQVKPDNGMGDMKGDMAGAAAVLGAMEVIGSLRPHCNVTAVIPACENMINGNGYRPGDVIDSFSGKTIEIQHTDAEGRLILADGLSYARRLGATSLVNVATLTGAVIVALGRSVTGLMTNHEDWGDEVKEAARVAGEKVWELPMFEEYEEYLKSSVADLKNEGGREAGCIQGGIFLKHFVEDTPWVHLDIAGTADTKGKEGFAATGAGVRTLAQLALRFSGK